MNTIQYATEILRPHHVPFIYSLPGNSEDYQGIEDELRAHTANLCQEYRKEYGITYTDWPPSSPDLNPIENAWVLLQVRLRKQQQQDPSKRFNIEDEFIQAAQEEWEKLDWAAVDRSIDSMNKRV
jgi:hypothetical protein